MNLQNEIERLAHELSQKKGNVTGYDLDNWLEAERIVAEWLKAREEKEGTKEKPKE